MDKLDSIRFCTFNMHGFNQGILQLKLLSQSVDVILLQEHWLNCEVLSYFDCFEDEFVVYHGRSAMESKLQSGILKGRPFGGICILIRKSLYKLFKKVSYISNSDRYMILSLDNLLLLNIYFPSCSNNSECDDLVLLLTEILDCINDISFDSLLIGGDFNCNVIQTTRQSLIINKFLNDLNLIECSKCVREPCSIQYTYCVEARNAHSTIDFFHVSDNCCQEVKSLNCIVDEANFSDHLPLVCVFDANFVYKNMKRDEPFLGRPSSDGNCNTRYKFDWDKSQTCQYYESTRVALAGMHDLLTSDSLKHLKNKIPHLFSAEGLNNIFKELAAILKTCALNSIPIVQSNSKQKPKKFWWDENLCHAKNESIKSHREWVNQGKPRAGPVYSERLRARNKYRKEIKSKSNKAKSQFSNKLKQSLKGVSNKNFWKIWNANFKQKQNKNPNINGLNDSKSISNYLAASIKEACAPNDILKNNLFEEKFKENKNKHKEKTEMQLLQVCQVEKSILNLGDKKAAGFDELTAEFVKKAHPSLVIILTKLYNCIILSGIIPDIFGVGVTTPIPKFKGCKRTLTAEDFRGITVNTILSKIFEGCLLEYFTNIKTSDRQLGFKSNLGCNDAFHYVQKTIKYFVDKKTTINIGVIDLRRAFDKVNGYALLDILLKKGVHINVINVLENWFSKNVTCVKYNGVFSNQVSLSAGVKQGGILSPLLFSIYVDNILDKLEMSGFGCYVNFACYNSYMYADDLILLSPSLHDLQAMFDLCAIEFNNIDLPVNENKCHCMRIGPLYKAECAELQIGGQSVRWVNEIRYLGITISAGKNLKYSWNEAKRKFFQAANSIFAKLGNQDSVDVLLHLIMTKALPHLTYGLPALQLGKSDLNSLSYAYNSVFAKTFSTKSTSVINACQMYFGYLDFMSLYHMYRHNFLSKLLDNNVIIGNTTIDRCDFNELQLIKNKYNLNINNNRYKKSQFLSFLNLTI